MKTKKYLRRQCTNYYNKLCYNKNGARTIRNDNTNTSNTKWKMQCKHLASFSSAFSYYMLSNNHLPNDKSPKIATLPDFFRWFFLSITDQNLFVFFFFEKKWNWNINKKNGFRFRFFNKCREFRVCIFIFLCLLTKL